MRRSHRAQTYVEVSRGKLSIAEIGGYLVIAPSPRQIKAVIDVHRGKGRSMRDNRRLMSLVQRTDADGDLWMVLGLASRKGGSANAGLADLKTVTASLDVASGLHMQMHLYAGSDQGATDVAGYLAQLAEQSADHPDLAALFGKLTVKRTGSRVAASMKLSASELTSLTRKLLAAK